MVKKIFGVIVAIAICELAGAAGSILSSPTSYSWYSGLNKAALNPPNWVFGPVWLTLYALMGISLFLVCQKGVKSEYAKVALPVFSAQLVLNVFWSVFFFGLRNPLIAYENIILLWVFIVWTIILFWKISRPAAWLLVPYLIWVTFATYLNYQVVVLN